MRTQRKMAAPRVADLREKVERKRQELEGQVGGAGSPERQAESLDPVPGRDIIESVDGADAGELPGKDEQHVPGGDEQQVPGGLDQQFVPGADEQDVPGTDEQHPPGDQQFGSDDEQRAPAVDGRRRAEAQLARLRTLLADGWDEVSEERGARLRAWLQD